MKAGGPVVSLYHDYHTPTITEHCTMRENQNHASRESQTTVRTMLCCNMETYEVISIKSKEIICFSFL